MSIPRIHKISKNKGKYSVFDSVKSFQGFVDRQARILSESNREVLKSLNQRTDAYLKSPGKGSWYGTPVPKDVSELDQHRYFLGMHLLKELQSKIKDQLEKYLKLVDQEVLSKPKVAYNDRGLGVFSFDRAAMGLYRLDPTNTQSPLATASSQLRIELDTQNKTTAVKSVYAFFQDRKTSYPALQVYLMAGGNANVGGDELLYVGLACVELVEFMETRGVAVEVNVLLGSSFRNKVIMGVIRLKRFQDKLDKNQLLLMTSDPRYFRYRGFKSLIALSDHFGYKIPVFLGSITPKMGKQFVKDISGTNTFYAVFEQSYSLSAAIKEVTQIITDYTTQVKKG